MQSLSIFGVIDGTRSEFTNLSYFWKFEKISNQAGPLIIARSEPVST
jgi:hypothetical protein